VVLVRRPLEQMRLTSSESGVWWETVVVMLIYCPWLYDIVRIGSAPVNTVQCPLAADLPRWAFTSFTVMWVAFQALIHGIVNMYSSVLGKRRRFDSSRMAKYEAAPL
ncbi:unnamed protein product, partial [Prorocentrum cordatum]